ncbi:MULTISPECIES: dicarboxylate/amino acid:cation symporter [unclassified Aureispira]|uniref:dicarboxylate/amino acid:cation symporter n=1 Tax=unclassified Aureispira TaxID=2649989 RepID=UPI000696F96B|nr:MULTISPECIES: dicarboxylate/amino acid:cation symporter [unclassified Aureispira]WMX14339.1 dicarboxylate/amino acid:cation symporter [Aureispira sp. CCB-E]
MSENKKGLALHWQILIGMAAGIAIGFALKNVDGSEKFVLNWVYPIGKIFVNLLKLIAVPLIIASLTKGIADLQDISKLSKIGGRTIGTYLVTTVIAVTLGLVVVNTLQPGVGLSQSTIDAISASNMDKSAGKVAAGAAQSQVGPLQFVIDMVPDNIFAAASSNGNMLQVIVFVLFFGICLLLIPKEKAKPMHDFFDSLNEVILKMVDVIMLISPYAVFALLCNLTVSTDPEIFGVLFKYALCVVLGLVLMVGIYMAAIKLFTGRSPLGFLKAISPAQLLAFSTSSSAATLPVTMERVEEHVGVEKEVTSFVCPIGATINMDGTSLYQAVAAVFICQVIGFDLSLGDQLTIVITATMASIGSAAVPGAGMVMLVIVLDTLGIPSDKLAFGIALIFAVDRPLDMCRTVINVTGDATVATLVGKSVGKLKDPQVKNWDDHYKKETI